MTKESNIKKAYKEVLLFLQALPKAYLDKIPSSILSFLKTEQDLKYHPLWENSITKDSDVKDLGLLQETLALIAWLNLEFFEENEDRKKELQELYERNQQNKEEWLALLLATMNKKENTKMKS